jgi:hypothetical protein
MCNAIAIMAVGQGIALMQQQDQADQVNRAANRQENSINIATAQSYNQLNRQGIEEAQNAAVEGGNLSQDVAARVATGRAQAGASGVAGLSVNAMLLNLAGKGLEAQTTADMNYARGVAARADHASEIESNAKGQLSGIQRAPGVGLLDVMGAGLKVGAAYTAQNAADQKAAAGNKLGTLAEQRAASLERMGSKSGGTP